MPKSVPPRVSVNLMCTYPISSIRLWSSSTEGWGPPAVTGWSPVLSFWVSSSTDYLLVIVAEFHKSGLLGKGGHYLRKAPHEARRRPPRNLSRYCSPADAALAQYVLRPHP